MEKRPSVQFYGFSLLSPLCWLYGFTLSTLSFMMIHLSYVEEEGTYPVFRHIFRKGQQYGSSHITSGQGEEGPAFVVSPRAGIIIVELTM